MSPNVSVEYLQTVMLFKYVHIAALNLAAENLLSKCNSPDSEPKSLVEANLSNSNLVIVGPSHCQCLSTGIQVWIRNARVDVTAII